MIRQIYLLQLLLLLRLELHLELIPQIRDLLVDKPLLHYLLLHLHRLLLIPPQPFIVLFMVFFKLSFLPSFLRHF